MIKAGFSIPPIRGGLQSVDLYGIGEERGDLWRAGRSGKKGVFQFKGEVVKEWQAEICEAEEK